MKYEHCPTCDGELCYLEREFEECVWCGAPLPVSLQLDLDKELMKVEAQEADPFRG